MAVYGPKEKPASNYAGQAGWSVGMASWLDDPASKVNRYWRVIEFGSAATGWPWKGKLVAGLWGPNAGPRGGLWGSATTEFSGRNNQKFAPYFSDIGQDMLGPARKALWDFMKGGKGPNMDKLQATYFYRVHEKKRKDGSVKRKVTLVTAHTPGQEKKARKAMFHWLLTKATDASQIPFVTGTIDRDIPPGDFYRAALASFPMETEQAQAVREALDFALHHQGKESTLTALRKQQKEDNYSGTAAKGRRKNLETNDSIRRFSVHGRARVSVAADVTTQSLMFDGGGRFVNGTWQIALREVNELIAMRFQDAVVAEMQRSSHRPPTNALIEATQDPHNRYPRDKG